MLLRGVQARQEPSGQPGRAIAKEQALERQQEDEKEHPGAENDCPKNGQTDKDRHVVLCSFPGLSAQTVVLSA